MTQDFFLQDGYRDQQTDEAISFHYRAETWAVRITPKNPGSSFALTDTWRELIEAIDYGTSATNSFVQSATKPASRVCGQLVTIYFKPEFFRNANWQPYIDPYDWANLLSQVRVLHDSFPPFFTISDSSPIAIKSPDFEAPNGIFNAISELGPEFRGSTFKKGPRIFGDVAMSTTPVWPPIDPQYAADWHPFEGCPQMESIEYQGDLGDYCERIFHSDLVYIDEDGYERVDAYPGGGKPRVIMDAIGPLTRFEMDSGSQFPNWDCSQLEICIRPVVAQEVVLPTRSTTVSLPIGPDLREANNLKFYSNGILNVTRGTVDGQLQPCPLVFGLKLIGVELPNSCERAINAHQIYRHQMDLSDDPLEAAVGIKATPQIVKETFNFSLGQALENYWGNNDEELLMPRVPSSATYLSRYAEVEIESSYYMKPAYFVQINPNGSVSGLEIPKIVAPNMVVLDGYMKSTFEQARSGDVAFTIPGGASRSGDIYYEIPAPPASLKVLRGYLNRTGANASGTGERITAPGGTATHTLFFGLAGEDQNDIGVWLVKNPTSSWFTGSTSGRQDLAEQISVVNYFRLQNIVAGISRPEITYNNRVSRNGFRLEAYDSSGLELAYDWMNYTWDGAKIDPTTMANVINPVSLPTKVSSAFNRTLHIDFPLVGEEILSDEITLNEPIRSEYGGSYVPSFTLRSVYGPSEEALEANIYSIGDINFPPFVLTEDDENVYSTWNNFFSSYVSGTSGDFDSFKLAHGIDEDKDIGGGDGIIIGMPAGTVDLNWIDWLPSNAESGGVYRSWIPPTSWTQGDRTYSRGVSPHNPRFPTNNWPNRPNFGEPVAVNTHSEATVETILTGGESSA